MVTQDPGAAPTRELGRGACVIVVAVSEEDRPDIAEGEPSLSQRGLELGERHIAAHAGVDEDR